MMNEAPLGSIERAYSDGYAAAQKENDRLRAVIIRYLDFAQDVGVSPVAPELKPIRDAMRAAVGYEQQRPEATKKAPPAEAGGAI